MLIPIADVPRWYAERKPTDTIAVSHDADAITWEQLERNANRRARAFAAKGVKPGDFVAIGLPNSNVFFETTFAVWKCGATPTSLTWRLPRGEAAAVLDILKPSLVVGGQPDWNAPNSLPADFVPDGFSDEPIDGPVARGSKASSQTATAEAKLDAVAGDRARLRTLWADRSPGRHDHIGGGMARAPGLGRQDRRDRAPAHHRRRRQRGRHRRDRRDLFPAQ